MRTYLLKRILFLIPSLLFISLLGFVIVIYAPGDPVKTILHDVTGNNAFSSSPALIEQEKNIRHRLGLDLPVFYFSIISIAEPDTLYKIYPVNERETLQHLLLIYGNWDAVSDYYLSLKKIIEFIRERKCYPVHLNNGINEAVFSLMNYKPKDDVSTYLSQLRNYLLEDSTYYFEKNKMIDDVTGKWNNVKMSRTTWRNYFPAIAFNGHNRFQRWLFGDGEFCKGIINGDFGFSYTTRQPVISSLKTKIKWSVGLSLISLVLALLIAVPLGTYIVLKPGSLLNKIFIVYKNISFATPVFWLGTLLLVCFANSSVLHLFPASGVQPGYETTASGGLQKFITQIWYLTLPLLCYSYSAIALLTSAVQSSLKDVMQQEFMKTAFAKGLSLKQAVIRHGLRNSLLPLITLSANVFPAALGGSVIIENIFSIPGMGNEIATSVYTQNYPVLIAIVMLTGFMSIAGYFLADILYIIADPRVRFAYESK